jgi:hypothetical protein
MPQEFVLRCTIEVQGQRETKKSLASRGCRASLMPPISAVTVFRGHPDRAGEPSFRPAIAINQPFFPDDLHHGILGKGKTAPIRRYESPCLCCASTFYFRAPNSREALCGTFCGLTSASPISFLRKARRGKRVSRQHPTNLPGAECQDAVTGRELDIARIRQRQLVQFPETRPCIKNDIRLLNRSDKPTVCRPTQSKGGASASLNRHSTSAHSILELKYRQRVGWRSVHDRQQGSIGGECRRSKKRYARRQNTITFAPKRPRPDREIIRWRWAVVRRCHGAMHDDPMFAVTRAMNAANHFAAEVLHKLMRSRTRTPNAQASAPAAVHDKLAA